MVDQFQARTSDRGAVLVHTAFALLALLAFTTVVVDFGTLWVARSQAQNAADSAALSGAVSLGFDGGAFTEARDSAHAVSQQNLVYGQPPAVNPLIDITFPAPGPDTGKPPCPLGIRCVRVEVFRDANHGNPLPVFFGGLVGLSVQGTRAVAVANVTAGNRVSCIRPFAVLDLTGVGGFYTPPGYTLQQHLGVAVQLTPGSPISPGPYQLLDLLGPPNVVADAIRSCIPGLSGPYAVGGLLLAEPGLKIDIPLALTQLIALDPGASVVSKQVVGGCLVTQSCQRYLPGTLTLVPDPNAIVSPRVIALPVIDPVKYALSGTLEIVNFVGFFLQSASGTPGNEVINGIIVAHPGQFQITAGLVGQTAAFVPVIQLVR